MWYEPIDGVMLKSDSNTCKFFSVSKSLYSKQFLYLDMGIEPEANAWAHNSYYLTLKALQA